MSRKGFRWGIVAVILIGLGTVAVQLRSTLRAQKQESVDRSPLDGMLPQAVQWIQNFHRVEIKDGKKSWEVEADEAQYLEEANQVLVRNPRAALFTKEGEEVVVTGGQGRVEFAGKDLQKVMLRDNVEIRVRDFVITAPEAEYDRSSDRIFARGAVSIVGTQLRIAGTDMIVSMTDYQAELVNDVRVTLEPAAAKDRKPS